jgi:hypothetical protein
MYPYGLAKNPFPSAATPGNEDIMLLGGERHKKAKLLAVACVEDIENKIQQEDGATQFRLVTVTQDVGSGKTHLALHLRNCRELSDKAMVSFTDLSQLLPRTIINFYNAMMKGFSKHHFDQLRQSILNDLQERAARDDGKDCRKIFRYNLWDRLKGNSLETKKRLILDNRFSHNKKALEKVFSRSFNEAEISMIQSIVGIGAEFNPPEVENLNEMLFNLGALAKINRRFLDRVTVFEIDECDSDRSSMDLLKAMINLHLHSTVLLVVLTPAAYEDIRNCNASLYDRLEKANYRIDLAGSNGLEEISEIILEYITSGRKQKPIDVSEQADIRKKVKILYEEFPEFRNIRSMINVMYHAIERASRNSSRTIDEHILDQTITSIYPGLKLRENFMSVPISEFIKIAEEAVNIEEIKSRVAMAIKALLNCASDNGRVTKDALLRKNGRRIEVEFDDFVGRKTSLEFSIVDGNSEFVGVSAIQEQDDNQLESPIKPGISSRDVNQERASMQVQVSRHVLVDLLYFGNKYSNNQVEKDEVHRALALGESLNLY